MSEWLKKRILRWLLLDKNYNAEMVDLELELSKAQLKFWKSELRKNRQYTREEMVVHRRKGKKDYVS